MSKRIVYYKCGGPEVLRWEDETVAAPARGQVLVRKDADARPLCFRPPAPGSARPRVSRLSAPHPASYN
jgi:hypothetical protein